MNPRTKPLGKTEIESLTRGDQRGKSVMDLARSVGCSEPVFRRLLPEAGLSLDIGIERELVFEDAFKSGKWVVVASVVPTALQVRWDAEKKEKPDADQADSPLLRQAMTAIAPLETPLTAPQKQALGWVVRLLHLSENGFARWLGMPQSSLLYLLRANNLRIASRPAHRITSTCVSSARETQNR